MQECVSFSFFFFLGEMTWENGAEFPGGELREYDVKKPGLLRGKCRNVHFNCSSLKDTILGCFKNKLFSYFYLDISKFICVNPQ